MENGVYLNEALLINILIQWHSSPVLGCVWASRQRSRAGFTMKSLMEIILSSPTNSNETMSISQSKNLCLMNRNPIEFKWKIKSGMEVIKIKFYIETVTQFGESVAWSQSNIDARVIDEASFPLKHNLMSLAHQQIVNKSIRGAKAKTSKCKNKGWSFKFSIQWIHNENEFKLKNLINKSNLLELNRDNIVEKYHEVAKDLQKLQNEEEGLINKNSLKAFTSMDSFKDRLRLNSIGKFLGFMLFIKLYKYSRTSLSFGFNESLKK